MVGLFVQIWNPLPGAPTGDFKARTLPCLTQTGESPALKSPGELLGALGPLLGGFGPLLGRSWAVLGRSWGGSWARLGRSWAVLGRSWAAPGRSWAGLGRSGGRKGMGLAPESTCLLAAESRDTRLDSPLCEKFQVQWLSGRTPLCAHFQVQCLDGRAAQRFEACPLSNAPPPFKLLLL